MNYGRQVIERLTNEYGISKEVSYWKKDDCIAINQYLIHGKLSRDSSSELILATNIISNSNVILKTYHIEVSRRQNGSRFLRGDIQLVSQLDKILDEIIIIASCNKIKGVINLLEILHDTKFNILYIIIPSYLTQLLWWNPYGEYYELTNYNVDNYVKDENVMLFSENFAKIIIKEIINTVHSLHKLGIIHKDIKPENILIKKPFNLDCTASIEIPSKHVYNYSNDLEPIDVFPWEDSIIINSDEKSFKYAKECMNKSHNNKIPLLDSLKELNYNSNPYIWNSNPPGKDNIEFTTTDTQYTILVDLGCFSISEPYDNTLSIFDSDGTPVFTSPECLEIIDDYQGIYGESRDIFSIGVTLFAMLYGVLPFSGNSGIQVFINMSEKDFKIPFHTFRNISDQGKDLLTKMLDRNYKKRITCEEALRHPWLNEIN